MPDERDCSLEVEDRAASREEKDGEPVIEGDENNRLRALDAAVRDQNDLERDIGRQVCHNLDPIALRLLLTYRSTTRQIDFSPNRLMTGTRSD